MTSRKEVLSNTQRKYGFISMLSMIVGIVIGSGIFFKNQSLFNNNGSVLISMYAWFLIAVVVLFMIVSFVEIASSTKKSGNPGSLSNWTTSFIGPNMGKMVGFFFVYVYFPIIFVILTAVFSSQIMEGLNTSLNISLTPWISFTINIVMAFFLFAIVAFINTLTSKPGKILQVSGTAIKATPLLLVIFSMMVLVFLVPELSGNMNEMWNPSDPLYNGGLILAQEAEGGYGIFKLLVLALPAVMFAFDGFIFASAVQNEAKNKNTFKLALISGMLIIVAIYLLTSIFVFAGADWSVGADSVQLSIQAILANIFPSTAGWLPVTVGFIIAISILTTTSGTFISASRSLSTLSEKNYIVDSDGTFLKRNKALVPEKAAIRMYVLTMIWFVVLRGFDAIGVSQMISAGENINLFAFSDFGADVITIFAFFTYSILLLSMVWNRKTKKVDVDKTKFASISGAISGSILLLITFLFLVSTISPPAIFTNFSSTMYTLKIIVFELCLIVLFIVYLWYDQKVKKTPDSVFKNKQKYINSFIRVETWSEEFEKDIEVLPKQLSSPKKSSSNRKK